MVPDPLPAARDALAVPPACAGVLAPLGRDAALVTERLRGGGLHAHACGTLDALCDSLEAGRFDALLLTSEGVAGAAVGRLRAWLRSQPSWSDVPVILLAAPRQPVQDTQRLLAAVGARASATVLERPVPLSALLAAVRLALLARRRQLEVRDLLGALAEAREALETRVAERTREVRRLAADLTLAEHSERRRIARLLHDDLQQRLYGLSVTLTLLERAVGSDPERAERLLRQAARSLRDTTALTRSLSHEMAAPTLRDEGLSELLGWVASGARERYGLSVEVDIEADVSVSREDVRVLLGQVLGELLLNAAKHAGVDSVRIAARAVPGAPAVRVSVEDRGRGFDPASADRSAGGMGLTSVRERAELVGGSFQIESAPDRGTRATLELPATDEGLAREPPLPDA